MCIRDRRCAGDAGGAPNLNYAPGCASLLLWILGYGHTGDWQVQSSGVTFPDRQQAVRIAGDAGKRVGQSERLPPPQRKHEL